MNAGLEHRIAYGLACLAFPFAGWWIARSALPEKQSTHDLRTEPNGGPSPRAVFPERLSGQTANRALALRRLVAAMDTEAMWQWLLAYGSDRELGEFRAAILRELADRLGWQIWDRALACEASPQIREDLCDSVLTELSHRDLWKAWEIYAGNRSSFSHSRWGGEVMGRALTASGLISAEKMIDVFRSQEAATVEESTSMDYDAQFDFAKALDFIVKAEHPPLLAPENLLSTWAQRSPAEAAAWMAGHMSDSADPYLENSRAGAFSSLVRAAGPERDEAWKILANLPDDYLSQAWSNLADGRIDPVKLEAATATRSRDEWLAESLIQTAKSAELDSSWDLIPLQERQALIEKADAKWAARATSPVSVQAREQWHQRLVDAWGAP